MEGLSKKDNSVVTAVGGGGYKGINDNGKNKIKINFKKQFLFLHEISSKKSGINNNSIVEIKMDNLKSSNNLTKRRKKRKETKKTNETNKKHK